MKKIVVLFSCILLLLAMTACGASQRNEPVMTPAVEAKAPAPASEATSPIATQAPSQTSPSAAPTETPSSTQQASASQEKAIKLYLNGNNLVLKAAPVMKDGVVFVPAAEILAAFSRPIDCKQDGDTLTIEDTERENTIRLTAGSAEATLNGTAAALDAAPVLADGTLLIPLTAFRTLFDADNKYTEEYASAYIVESGLC